MLSSNQNKKISLAKFAEDSDLSLEVVLLLILAIFMALFGQLLFWIHTGDLPYAPDSAYGLFLVLVAIQTITLGKTPFGDLRRSWMLVAIGTGAAVFGMTACFIPGLLSEPVHTFVGLLLTTSGVTLLLRLLFSEEKAKSWIRISGILRHLTLALVLVYGLSIIAGLVTLFPRITTDFRTAVLLIFFGASFFYLAWSLQAVSKSYPSNGVHNKAPKTGNLEPASLRSGLALFREASLSLSVSILLLLAILLTLLGMLLFPVALGLLSFSPDGQFGLMLVLMAIQMMAMGETPMGQYRRSWLLTLLGMGFATLGIFSCIVPGILTEIIRILLGILTLGGGLVFLGKRVIPLLPQREQPTAEINYLTPIFKEMQVTQTLLNLVAIVFGLSTLLPGVIPLLAIASILIINGLLLFKLSFILLKLDTTRQDAEPALD